MLITVVNSHLFSEVIMSMLSDGLWEDLENISLPSLPFQLQFPDSTTPLQCDDEADLLQLQCADQPVLAPDLNLDLDTVNVTADNLLLDHVTRHGIF